MLFVKKKPIHEPLIFLFQDAEVVGEHSSPFDVLMICPAFINGYPGYSNRISSIK